MSENTTKYPLSIQI